MRPAGGFETSPTAQPRQRHAFFSRSEDLTQSIEVNPPGEGRISPLTDKKHADPSAVYQIAQSEASRQIVRLRKILSYAVRAATERLKHTDFAILTRSKAPLEQNCAYNEPFAGGSLANCSFLRKKQFRAWKRFSGKGVSRRTQRSMRRASDMTAKVWFADYLE